MSSSADAGGLRLRATIGRPTTQFICNNHCNGGSSPPRQNLNFPSPSPASLPTFTPHPSPCIRPASLPPHPRIILYSASHASFLFPACILHSVSLSAAPVSCFCGGALSGCLINCLETPIALWCDLIYNKHHRSMETMRMIPKQRYLTWWGKEVRVCEASDIPGEGWVFTGEPKSVGMSFGDDGVLVGQWMSYAPPTWGPYSITLYVREGSEAARLAMAMAHEE